MTPPLHWICNLKYLTPGHSLNKLFQHLGNYRMPLKNSDLDLHCLLRYFCSESLLFIAFYWMFIVCCFLDIYSTFLIYCMFIICLLYVYCIFIICFLDIHCKLIVCLLYSYWMFIAHLLYAYCIFIAGLLYVYYMLTAYLLLHIYKNGYTYHKA